MIPTGGRWAPPPAAPPAPSRSLLRTGGLQGHHAGQRHGLPLCGGGAEKVPLPDAERLQRPVPAPAGCFMPRGPASRANAEPNLGKAGPPFVQFANEGGFLPAPVTLTGASVPTTLLLAPAERAECIVDFTSVPAGSFLILYSDAPAPFPGRRPAQRLLPRRPESCRRRHPAGLWAQHPDHHADQGEGPGRRGGRVPAAGAAAHGPHTLAAGAAGNLRARI